MALAAKGHSRTSAFKEFGCSWHTFRQVAADYPHIKWRRFPGPKAQKILEGMKRE
jgi:hypothetical protein